MATRLLGRVLSVILLCRNDSRGKQTVNHISPVRSLFDEIQRGHTDSYTNTLRLDLKRQIHFNTVNKILFECKAVFLHSMDDKFVHTIHLNVLISIMSIYSTSALV